jgi:hypothetical protein
MSSFILFTTEYDGPRIDRMIGPSLPALGAVSEQIGSGCLLHTSAPNSTNSPGSEPENSSVYRVASCNLQMCGSTLCCVMQRHNFADVSIVFVGVKH